MDVLPGFEAQRRSCEARLLGELGDATFRQCLDRGRTLDRGAAIDYGLGVKSHAAKRGPDAHNPLTRREREVAELIAQGLSNKDIAMALVIAQRTAETHVEHILTKLGFSSRAQVASWIGEQQH